MQLRCGGLTQNNVNLCTGKGVDVLLIRQADNGYNAVVSYDSEIEMFRGDFLGLNGGADFYATSVKALHQEGAISLSTFLDVCKEKGIKPVKQFSGKFNAGIPPELHEKLVITAAAQGKSLNEFVRQAIEHAVAYA